ncbi:type II methionyl aminopeptidase [Nanoarchaeota archaeon]
MDKNILDKHIEAGKIVSECLKYGAGMIKPGASILEVLDKVEAKIMEMGGYPAFPAQISINNVAAHACPGPESTEACKEGDMIKLDIGVHIDGYIADSAVTVDLGDNKELVNASREALAAALKLVAPGVKVSELGAAIQEVIESYGFAPIRNLSGHGLNRFVVHDAPQVPNFNTGSDIKLEEDQVIAVEPFASTGAGIIYESSNPTLFNMSIEKPVRNMMARKLLKDIKEYKGLPFTTRWLTKKHSLGVVKLGLRELIQNNILNEYPPLIDKEDGIVSQAEHTVIVRDKPIITTK